MAVDDEDDTIHVTWKIVNFTFYFGGTEALINIYRRRRIRRISMNEPSIVMIFANTN